MNNATFTFRGTNLLVIELESELWFRAKDLATAVNRDITKLVGQENIKPLHVPSRPGRPALFIRQIGLIGFFSSFDRSVHEDLMDLARLQIWPKFAESYMPKSLENPYCPKSDIMVPALQVRDGTVFANSTDVAEFFDKQHKHVLRDIRNLQRTLTAQNRTAWFRTASREQKTGFGTRRIETFDMTRDGFALLAMGFTGEKALGFKVILIEEFNRMERELSHQPALPDFTNPAIAARAWADEVEQKHQLIEENASLKEELNLLTADEYRALIHIYLDRRAKSRLGHRAAKLCRQEGIEIKKQQREIKGNVVHVGIYPRHILDQAANELDII